MYNIVSQGSKTTDVLNKIGYKYYDINKDGIDELLVGEIAEGNWKGIIYDIYTMVNRKPVHVISGGARNRFFVCNNAFLCNEYSSGAMESGLRTYSLTENSTELIPQVSFKYDGYKNEKKPYFISYESDINNEKNWENVDEKTYYERIKRFENYNRFDFIKLSKYKK